MNGLGYHYLLAVVEYCLTIDQQIQREWYELSIWYRVEFCPGSSVKAFSLLAPINASEREGERERHRQTDRQTGEREERIVVT